MPNVKTQTPIAWAANLFALVRKGSGGGSTSELTALGSAAAANVGDFEPVVTLATSSSGTPSLALGNNRTFLRLTHASPVLTVPLQVTVAFPDGFTVWGVMTSGGSITIPSGGTINGVNNATVEVGAEADGAGFTLRRIGTNAWSLVLGASGGGEAEDMTPVEIATALRSLGAGERDDFLADLLPDDEADNLALLSALAGKLGGTFFYRPDDIGGAELDAGQLLETVAEIATGVWSVENKVADELDTDPDTIFGTDESGTPVGRNYSATMALLPAASDTVSGRVELATTAETNTGSDAARAVTPDGLAGSIFGTAIVQIEVFAPTADVTTGDGAAYFHTPADLAGMDLIGASALVITAGTTGTTDVQIARVRSGTPADMLSTKITIDSTETDSATAATAAVINGSNDDLATSDILRIDVDATATTKAKGLLVTLRFRLP